MGHSLASARKSNSKSRIAMIIRTLVILLGLCSLASANHGSPKNCNDCASLNGGNVRMCLWDGNFAQPDKAYCCRKGFFSEYCVDASYNKCSAYFSEQPDAFVDFCPGVLEENCGAPREIKVSTEEKIQTITGLTYDDTRADSCYYVVGNPSYKYMEGAKVYIEFTKISPGVDLFVRASSDISNSTSATIPNL